MISTLITEYSQAPLQVMEPVPMPAQPQRNKSSNVVASVVLALLFVCLSIGAFIFAPDEENARKTPRPHAPTQHVRTMVSIR